MVSPDVEALAKVMLYEWLAAHPGVAASDSEFHGLARAVIAAGWTPPATTIKENA